MNRGITSAPTNWGIDYSQNQTGAIMGNAMANTGNMLGNAIMQYAKDKKEREEKKAKEEAATRFILASGVGKEMGIVDEKTAKQAVTGIGVENVQNFIQLQQRQKQIEQETARVAAQEAQVAQKAQEVEREKIRNQQFLGQIAGAAPWRNAPAQTPQDVFAAAARTGVDPRAAATMANTLPPPAKQAGPVNFITDPVTGARFAQHNGAIQPSNPPRAATPKPDSTEFSVGGVDYVIGPGGKYFDKKTGKPVSFGESPGSVAAALIQALGVKPEPTPPPQGTATPEDEAAIKWLKENQNDPDAAGVTARLRAKGLL
jgi:hypothetical protein